MIKIEIFLFVIFINAFLACSQANNSSKGESDETTGNELNDEPVKPIDVEEEKLKYLITDSMVGPFKMGGALPGPATMMKIKNGRTYADIFKCPIPGRQDNDLINIMILIFIIGEQARF